MADRQPEMTKEETCLEAYFLERWSVITKLCKFELIPAKVHVFMIAPKKWMISSPIPFATSVQCNILFNLVNLKPSGIAEIPEGCSMHLCKHKI
jgi:hypothetical protein